MVSSFDEQTETSFFPIEQVNKTFSSEEHKDSELAFANGEQNEPIVRRVNGQYLRQLKMTRFMLASWNGCLTARFCEI
jgi:hypothetical protein